MQVLFNSAAPVKPAARREADRRYDRMAGESAALDRHEAGICC